MRKSKERIEKRRERGCTRRERRKGRRKWQEGEACVLRVKGKEKQSVEGKEKKRV